MRERDDKFAEAMGDFCVDARSQCDTLQAMFKKMESSYGELEKFYVFDKQKYTLEEFITDVKTFKNQFKDGYTKIIKERDANEKLIRAREAREKQEKERAERALKKKALIDFNAPDNQEGVMDSLLEALKTGSAFNRDQKRKRAPRAAGAERRAQLNRSRSRGPNGIGGSPTPMGQNGRIVDIDLSGADPGIGTSGSNNIRYNNDNEAMLAALASADQGGGTRRSRQSRGSRGPSVVSTAGSSREREYQHPPTGAPTSSSNPSQHSADEGDAMLRKLRAL